MRNRAVASRYARALLDSAKTGGVLADVAESFDGVMALMADTPRLQQVLTGPQVDEAGKLALLKTAFGGRIEVVLLNFFRLLVEKQRLDALEEIHAEFQLLVEIEQGFARALVTTAVPLPADLEEALKAKLSEVTGRTIVLRKEVDPAVMGGACVTMGDQVIDGTLRTNLDRVRTGLMQTDVRG